MLSVYMTAYSFWELKIKVTPITLKLPKLGQIIFLLISNLQSTLPKHKKLLVALLQLFKLP